VGAARQLSAGLDRIGILPGPRTPNSRWGAALVAGDFDGNGFADLATGAPERDTVETPENAGAVGVSYGQLFIDGFETGDAMEWD
jgi:hypothetical protein